MAHVGTLAGYPNVLVVYGSDVYSRDPDDDYRERLRDLLYDRDRGPVRRGSHDFWVTYPVPAVRDVSSEHAHEDMGVEPRPMRGIIRINRLPRDLSVPELKSHLRLVAQEVGHHWLVPHDLRFRQENGDEIGLDESLADHLIDRQNVEGLPLLGRENIHWSPYWDADASPLDGQDYERLAEEDGWGHWNHAPTFQPDPPLLSNFGLPFFFRGIEYNDLELAIMGVLDPRSAYGGGSIRWLSPRLAAPLGYEVGILVAFSRVDMLRFGFGSDHRTLIVRRSSQPGQPRVALGKAYRPLSSDGFNGVQLRIVRRGDTYHCQARLSRRDRDVGGPRVPGLFDDLETQFGRTTGTFEQFRTVQSVKITERPRAIGMYVLTSEKSVLAEGAFYNLELRVGDRTFVHQFEDRPSEHDLDVALADLPAGEVISHIPARGGSVDVQNKRLLIRAPFNHEGDDEQQAFLQTDRLDRLPKVLRSVPDRDFAFGTVAWVLRSMLPPWAGGDAAGREYWGREGSIPARRVILPDRQAEKRERPLDGHYRAAFIIVSTDRSRAESIVERVDRTRSAWQAVFSAAAARNDARDGRSVTTDL